MGLLNDNPMPFRQDNDIQLDLLYCHAFFFSLLCYRKKKKRVLLWGH